VVALSYARAQIGRAMMGSGFVVPRGEPAVGILAATWITSKWPHRAPDDRVLMRAFLGGARDPGCLDSPDEALAATAAGGLAAVLEIVGAPQWSHVYRWPLANPQYEVGHLARVAAIDARLAALPGLHLAGSGFRAIGLPDVIADARAAAAAVAEDRNT
jgi:oxygen-dependent protoporphyrinogen oxidase